MRAFWRRPRRPRLVERVTLEAGDVLAVQLEPRARTDSELQTICDAVHKRVIDGVEVMVFDGARFAVLPGKASSS